MNESDDEPASLPCSAEEARLGMPVMVQLHLVDAALEKNPHPREEFYRQYSVTPERQTPEGERTPPPPTYSPGEILRSEKAWAERVAKALKQFHAGRVMLRKEEAEQHEVLEDDPDYWSSKANHWQDEGWRLMKEMGKRKKLELKGEVEEGYAQAMFLSPLQAPSPPPSNGGVPEVAQHLNSPNANSNDLPGFSTRPSQYQAGPSQVPLPPTPNHNSNDPSTPTKGQKRTRTETEGHEESSMDQNSHTKRQRRETSTPQQKHEPVPSTQGPGKNISNVSRTKAKQEATLREFSPKAALAQRTLPWNLRSSNSVSYREISTGTTNDNGARQGKRNAYQRKPRLPGT